MKTILSTYLTARIDEQLKTQLSINDYSYVKNLVDSCESTYTNCIILVDFDCTFDNTEFVKFVKYNHFRNVTPHLRRFKLFNKFINNSNYDVYLTCDCRDVIILQNPFNQIIINDKMIYAGSENIKPMKGNKWVDISFSQIDYDWTYFADKRLLNCGIIGGYRDILIKFFNKYINNISTLEGSGISPAVIDMFSFNRTIYEDFPDQFITGSPLHTEFSKFDHNNKIDAIAHK